MKLKNKIIPGLLLLASVGLSSCEDFLDTVNPNEVTSSSYYSSISDCESSLAAVYNAFKDMDCYRPLEEMLRSDLAIQGSWTVTSAGRAANTYSSTTDTQTFNNTETACNEKWEALYRGIFRANQLIEGLEKYESSCSDDNKDTWETIMGEALFLRGVFHYWLAISYNGGNVPIVDETPDGSIESLFKSLPDGGAEEVREFYVNDFKSALEYNLPDEWEAAYKGRIERGTVYAYLAQDCLYNKEYSEAAAYFEEVFALGVYSLAEVGMNVSAVDEFTSESILEVSYTEDYYSEQSSTDQKGGNTWHGNFATNGTSVYYSLFPAGWLMMLINYEDEVDYDNPSNWNEIEIDDVGNIVVMYGDYDYRYEVTTASTGITKVYSMVHKLYSDTEVGTFGTTYSRGIQLRTRTYDADGNTDTDDDTYATSYYRLDKEVIVKEENGVYYRLRQFPPRAAARMALANDTENTYYGGYADYTQTTQIKSHSLGMYREFTNHDLYTTENNVVTTGYCGTNLRLMTLTDVYLMYAECKAQLGDTQTALDYINKVRYRGGARLLGSEGEYAGLAGYDGESYSSSAILDILMYVERPLEVGTGQATRVCDLRRWGITHSRFKELSTYEFNYGPTYVVVPTQFVSGSDGITKATRYASRMYTDEDITYIWTNFASWIVMIQDVTDFSLAAENYTEADNAYWPIPNDEILANPNFN